MLKSFSHEHVLLREKKKSSKDPMYWKRTVSTQKIIEKKTLTFTVINNFAQDFVQMSTDPEE